MYIERGVVDEVLVKYEDIRIVPITVKVVVDAARFSACRRDHSIEDFENLFSFFRLCDNGSDYGAARPLHGIASFCLVVAFAKLVLLPSGARPQTTAS
jgi:hypothetical protein